MLWHEIWLRTVAILGGARSIGSLSVSIFLGGLDSATRALVLPLAAGLLLGQLDELFVDANYLLRGLHRRARRVIGWKSLDQVPQKDVAILVPAWREAEVIRRMLEHNLTNIDYDRARYTVFCGTYANDPETQAEVDDACRRFAGVRKVVVPHAGPTSKADCLNWIYQGVVREEQRRGRRFDILLLHDAEDVIHPLSLRLYSLLIPRYELVQTPILSLPLGCRQAVAATHIDELTERHLKEMPVREAIGGFIPSAGGGSAFDREAFAQMAVAEGATGARPFDPESLSAGYEVGLDFRLGGRRVHFACHAVEPSRRSASTGPGSAVGAAELDLPAGVEAPRPDARGREEIIATRGYLPDTLVASMRQRSGAILGRALQAWRRVGWPGPLGVAYCLWRDRKTLFMSALLGLAGLLVGLAGLRAGVAALGVGSRPLNLTPAGWRGSMLLVLVVANLAALAWRMAVRAWLVGRLYGTGHALLSGPRLVLGGLIGVAATARALFLFVQHRLTGKPLRSEETAHAFPSPSVLRARQRRLGEVLTDEYGLDRQSLELGLSLQQAVGRPLGEVLSLLGLVSEQTVTRALAELHEMAEGDPWAGRAPEHLLTAIGEEEAERLGVVPIAPGVEGNIRVAAELPLDGEVVRALEERFGSQVEVVLAPPAAVRRSRQQAYRRLLTAGELDGSTTPVARQRVRPEEVDWSAVVQIGHGYCAFYAILPLLPVERASPGELRRAESVRPLAAAFPVHTEVLATVAMRLRAGAAASPRSDRDLGGSRVRVPADPHDHRHRHHHRSRLRQPRDQPRVEPRHRDQGPRELENAIEVVPAPLLDIDVAMALCPSAAVAEPAPGTLTLELLRALESSNEGDPRVAACSRAGRLGLPITSSSGAGPVHWAVLPTALQGRDPIFIHGLADRSLILATASPSPRLFRTVGNLYPRWAIAWRVELPDGQHHPVLEELPCTTRKLPAHPFLNN
jgi:adsorption protein B